MTKNLPRRSGNCERLTHNKFNKNILKGEKYEQTISVTTINCVLGGKINPKTHKKNES